MNNEEQACTSQPEMSGISAELRGLRSRDEKPLNRIRYLELAEIAKGICDTLEKMGVKRHEGCTFKGICERLWELG